jgi:hypothetical protein
MALGNSAGSALPQVVSSTTQTIAIIAGTTAATQTFTVPGLLPAQTISLSILPVTTTALPAAVLVGNVWCSAANTQSVSFYNTGSATTATAYIFNVIAH